jgi:hypothetical protein
MSGCSIRSSNGVDEAAQVAMNKWIHKEPEAAFWTLSVLPTTINDDQT